ncbi:MULTISPECIES: radical SAM protein [Sphaerospermopsis]|nr:MULTISPECIES: radical SAM protein [Sphaerospermopsis]MBD2131252.1 radical SAM protein [Sphaerospermopsis sp. FACHB-1094]MBD2145614.1 radical SAM protein [Sphaerospermopsis sp. FACHB-1194]
MKYKINGDGEQLSLFSLTEFSEVNYKKNSVLFINQTTPSKIASSKIEYINSSSLLTSPSGFIRAYKFTLNPYSGCSFGCEYCYARFFAPTIEQQKDWGNWVKVKENAIDLLHRSCKAKSQDRRLETGDTIYMSSVTDPYQPIEHKVGLTRRILEELVEIQPRLTIQTRSPIVVRDIDLLKQFQHIRVNFTITTDSEDIRLRYEPHCPSIEARLKAARHVSEAGVPIGISISPMLPIKDPEIFGQRIAKLNAAEYVTQFFKPTRSRFSAGSSPESIQKMKEDNWTETKYQKVRATLISILGNELPLLEGNEGYAPV